MLTVSRSVHCVLGSVVTVAVDGRQQSRVDGQLDVAVDTNRREVPTAAGGRRGQSHYGPVRLAVEVEGQLPAVDVEQDSDHRTGRDSAIGAR